MQPLNLPKISPVAVTTNLQEFVGEHLDSVTEKIEEIADRIDELKTSLVLQNNEQSTIVESLSKRVALLESNISDTVYSQADEAEDFVWVADNFSTDLKQNVEASTALINTDRGVLTLKPKNYRTITDISYELDKEVMKASKTLPGCNMLALEVSPGSTDSEPQAVFETANVNSLSNLFDNNAGTHFEAERNFIYEPQKVKQFGKAFVSDVTGSEKSVLTVTNNFDWRVNIGWPKEASLDEGPDKKGYPIAEFISSSNGLINGDRKAEFSITLTLNNPETLSGVRVIPYIRHKKGLMKIKQASVYLTGLADPVIIAKDFGLNTNETTATKYNLFNLKSVDVSSGKFVPINSTRPVEKIVMHFEGSESEDLMLGHPFVWINLHRRSERNYGLFKSVDHEDIPKRLELFSAGRPAVEFTDSSPSAMGVIDDAAGPGVGTVTESENKSGPLGFLSESASQAASQVVTKNIYTNFMIQLGVGLGLVENLLNIGGFNRTFTVTDQKSGVDLFKGFRSTIAIKSISLERVQYADTGVYQSNKMVFPKPVSRISLLSEVDIPEEWGDSGWVDYSYSIDDGVTWSRILPSAGSDFDNSIKLPSPITKIQMRIELNRPLNDMERTPTVLYYAVKGFTG